MNKLTITIGSAVLFAGCTYAISPDLVNQADKTIPFEQLEENPESYKGKLIILGGTIVRTSHTEQGTLIEVVQKNLDNWGKPMTTKQSGGRVMVLNTGYLDILAYIRGRDITVAGVVEGSRCQGLEKIGYSYPLLLSKEIKLWPSERRSWDRPQHLDPLYDPYVSPRQYL